MLNYIIEGKLKCEDLSCAKQSIDDVIVDIGFLYLPLSRLSMPIGKGFPLE